MTEHAQTDLPVPTDAELAILNVLWERGAATAREVYEVLYRDQRGVYTAALKLLQIMHGKGLVARDTSGRAHVYRPVINQRHTRGRLLSDLVDRVFGGSASQLVLQALGSEPSASPEELEQIRTLLDRLEEGR